MNKFRRKIMSMRARVSRKSRNVIEERKISKVRYAMCAKKLKTTSKS